MAYTVEMFEKLQDAIATGAMQIRIETEDGQVEEVKFRTQAQMLALEEKLKRELGLGGGQQVTSHATRYDPGLR